jgi:AcrR family transcriptional regulator
MDSTAPVALLESALTCFLERGLHAASTDYIATAAQISHGRLYRSVANKDELIKQVYDHVLDQLQAPLRSPAGVPKDYERLQPLLARWWQMAASAAQTHPRAFAFWRLYRTSRTAFGVGEPLLGPFALLPEAMAPILKYRTRTELPNPNMSPTLLVTLLTAQWTAVVEVLLTDPDCRTNEKLRTKLLTQSFEGWWRGLSWW